MPSDHSDPSSSGSTNAAATDEALDIAIVGMAGRFPGARNVDEFWENLASGKESIRQLSDEELLSAGVSRRDLEHPDYVKVCPVLDDVDKFDAAFFGMSPRDASVMDPAHRFFLEVAWSALEHSGNTGLPSEGRVGVFAGSGAPLYWMNNVRSHREIMESMGEFLVRHTGNDMNFLATRASYDLDLRGPSINVQTACSSALVAAHLARQSLLSRECDMALIGGSTIVLPMGHGYHYKEGEILSPDGHCRPFDHRSAGTVFGSGTAVLVLKRLSDALDNGDAIHAVLKGSAINNDGSVKVGFLAPGVDGQVDVIRDALKAARVEARSISYVETHGTGTSVGDPIELSALDQAFSDQTSDKQFCGIGSVKSNIGHLGEAAAGASLIKVVMALKHRKLPPSLGFEKPNPRFPLSESPFYVNATLRDWNTTGPLRAGITALGAGGTNCHLVLEEAPPVLPGEGERDRHLLVLSAKSKSALERMSLALADHLERHPEVDIADVAYTLCMGRRALSHRRVLSVRDAQDAVSVLRGESPTRAATMAADADGPEVVFMFPGGGAQYSRMCMDLYDNEPVFRDALNECFEIIDTLDPNTRGLLFAAPADAEVATKKLTRPTQTLPTLFAAEYALAKLFESYGIVAAAYVGHSMGECVAACLAGVFTLREGLRLVHLRGQLFEKAQRGRMIGVSLSEVEARRVMPEGLSLAVINAPELCVASGPSEIIDAFTKTLTAKEIDWTPIHIDVAAHSSLLDPILPEFRAFLRTINYRPPTKPIASNLTGRWLTAAEAMDPEYWVKHLRNTVRFADCIETVLKGGPRVFLEVGPGRTLATLAAAQATKVRTSLNSVRHPNEPAHDMEYALLTLGKVWAAGANVDWTALYDGQIRNRVPLPTYPFDGVSYWVAPKPAVEEAPSEPIKRDDMNAWFQGVVWEPTPLVTAAAEQPTRWLLLARDRQLASTLSAELKRLASEALDVVTVLPGEGLRRIDESTWECVLGSLPQTRDLLEQLQGEGWVPQHIVLLQAEDLPVVTEVAPDLVERVFRLTERAVGIQADAGEATQLTDQERVQRAFFEPVHLGQAIASVLESVSFSVVTEQAFGFGDEQADPFAQLALGPVQVIPRELPEVTTRLVDVAAVPTEPKARTQRVVQLARELMFGTDASPVALRGRGRYARKLRPVALPSAEMATSVWADGDVVLITGGLGGMGLSIAERAASTKKIKLALLSREGLPPKAEWTPLLQNPATSASVKRRIASVMELEARGAFVLPVRGDVAKRESLAAALNEVHATFGSIDVVIHAAGVMDDEPLQTKTDDKMERVLAAKVYGARNLDELIDYDLKAFTVMSSVASLLGLPGQVDYTAANAFLDGFAQQRQQRAEGKTLAINWNAWRDVGMVVDVEERAAEAALPTGKTAHPWLDAVETTTSGRRYFTDFSIARHWLLSEHRIIGRDALIPGTGFVELARAAASDAFASQGNVNHGAGRGVELRDVTFQRPFQVADGTNRRLQIDAEWVGEGLKLTARTAGSADVHFTAEAHPLSASADVVDLAAARVNAPTIRATRDGFLDQDFVAFGERWRNIREIRQGGREALLTLELHSAIDDDLSSLQFHPGLLDMATGAAQTLIPGFHQATDFWVPFGYDRVCVFAPVARRVHSHVRLLPQNTKSVATFDVDVTDTEGRVLISARGFTMKRVDASDAITQKAPASAGQASRKNPAMEALLREAITRDEGVVAFERAVAQGELSQVVASSVDLNVWMRKLAREADRLKGGSEGEASAGFARPDLDSEFVAPTGALETQLAAIWSRLLGVTNVGVLDDFFELGGNSLVAVRFFAQVKKEFGISLPLSTLFQAPTIRTLADALREQGYVEAVSSEESESTPATPKEVSVATAATRKVPAPLLIRSGTGAKPPIFFVHDGLGEVLLYRSLALRLAPGHAVYGLPPETAAGRIIHTTVSEMARAKMERIKTVQPEGPYLLAGLCAGGVIAFELARQLQDRGEQTLYVGLIDAVDVDAEEVAMLATKGRLERIKETIKPAPGRSLVDHLGTALPTLGSKASNYLKYEVGVRIERARNARSVQQLRTAAVESSSKTPEIEFIKIYEHAHREHEAQGVFAGGDVVLFRATQGDGTLEDRPFREVYADPLLGWTPRISEPLAVIDIPGGHSSALQDPHVETLAEEMQRTIDKALTRARQRS